MKDKSLSTYCLFILLLTGNASRADEFLVKLSEPSSEERSTFQQEIKDVLNDPDSAKFRRMTIIDDNTACVEVNSKNVYGGYPGFQNVVFIKYETEGAWIFNLNISKINSQRGLSHKECIDTAHKANKLKRATYKKASNKAAKKTVLSKP